MAPPNDLAPAGSLKQPAPGAGRPDAAALQPNIGAVLHDLARLMRRRFERRARQTGLPLTRHQAVALLLIARNEGLRQAAVATMLEIEPIALSRVLDRLHHEGLVERRPHPTDRRVRTLWLTASAWSVIDQVLAINAEIREEACTGLAPAARDTLVRALGHMKDNLALVEEEQGIAAE